MAHPPQFIRDFDPAYGQLIQVSPLIRRLVATNKSPFTAWGTGTYVVGRGNVAIIDPGPEDIAHIDTLRHALAGERITHIVITHTHMDHSPGARLLRQHVDAPVVGCPRPLPSGPDDEPVEEGMDPHYQPDQVLADGDSISGPGWTLQAVYTPGHTSNHTCFCLPEEQSLFTGDHVMGWSTTVVSPPDGNMTDYMASLHKVLARGDRVLYPTHGAPITQPKPFVEALIAHRHQREQQILGCLAGGAATIPDMVGKLYADVDPRLHKAAGRSVLAHLTALISSGRVSTAEHAPAQGMAVRYRLP